MLRIAIIDTGISRSSAAYERTIESFSISSVDGHTQIVSCELTDFVGHGTAVSHIICSINPNVDIISFRLCNQSVEVDEDDLLLTLNYIYINLKVDIINISAGITFTYKHREMKEICKKLYDKNVLLVAAFDNDGAITHPAMLEEVIGVDITNTYDKNDDIYVCKNGIVDVFVPNIHYRTFYLKEKTILRGTSFASAKITGLLSLITDSFDEFRSKSEMLQKIATKTYALDASISMHGPSFSITKAIVFPVNKETHALLRYKDLMRFDIAGVYDERVTGNVGRTILGEKVQSYDAIEWSKDFDTVILSCTSQLTKLTKREYDREILQMAQVHGKNVFAFEDVSMSSNNVFYPEVLQSMSPQGNHNKLHQVTIPVVGVLGTSAKQGKYSLQLELIRRLIVKGYTVGHLSTEPSGYLFGADFVYHCGYQAKLEINPWDTTAMLNQMAWEIQCKNKDIMITGGQSGTIPYNDAVIEQFSMYQYAFLLGTQPDVCILCVNPHDDMEYVSKTIGFINSIIRGRVYALVVFPIQTVETLTGLPYAKKELSLSEQEVIKTTFSDRFSLPTYLLGSEIDMSNLVNDVIEAFS